MDIPTIKIKKVEYVECAHILEKAPIYSKGSRNTRTLVKKKLIPDNMYMFAKQDEEDNWIKTTGDSIKFDKILLKKEYLKNIPELQERDDDVVIVDENGIPEAPEIIDLADDEKFKDGENNIVEIETRGKRDWNGIYFRVKDVEVGFGLKYLHKTVINKDSCYEEDIDYKSFICKGRTKNSEKVKATKELFVTYIGMLRVLFTSKSGKTNGFIKWAAETLFTVQMGSSDQKNILASNVLGISTDSLKTALSASTNLVSCIYRFALGTCKNLRKTMNLPMSIPDDHIIIKYGFTDNLLRRTNQHCKTYNGIKGVKLELMNYVLIDPRYISKAEVDIKEYYTTIETKIQYKSFDELVAINPKHEKEINKQYKYIATQYSGCVKELMDIIDDLRRDNEKEKLKIENMEKIHKLELEKRDEQHKNALIEEQFKLREAEEPAKPASPIIQP